MIRVSGWRGCAHYDNGDGGDDVAGGKVDDTMDFEGDGMAARRIVMIILMASTIVPMMVMIMRIVIIIINTCVFVVLVLVIIMMLSIRVSARVRNSNAYS